MTYAPILIEMRYNFSKGFENCPEMLLTWIDATASPNNIASYRILDKLGFTCAKPALPVLKEGDPIPEKGPYNIEVTK